jgi:hypothetical protein
MNPTGIALLVGSLGAVGVGGYFLLRGTNFGKAFDSLSGATAKGAELVEDILGAGTTIVEGAEKGLKTVFSAKTGKKIEDTLIDKPVHAIESTAKKADQDIKKAAKKTESALKSLGKKSTWKKLFG